ncbi:MAG TPA: hypothetical protein VEC13_02780, partial [Candidatus Paceibacterota bacterium]|nr:hypothetical protein [Candidatus Paceibacterota bacterium]
MKFFRRDMVIWTLSSIVLLLVVNAGYIQNAFFHEIVPGNDSLAHVTAGKYYAENIFPSLWGYMPTGFSGMPFPQFYAPAFHVGTSAIYTLTGISYDLIYKLLTFLMMFVGAPIVFSLLTFRSVKSNLGRIAAIAVFIITTSIFWGKNGNFGGTIQSVVEIGLVPQLLSLLFCGLWAFTLQKFLEGKHLYFILGTFLLALAFLASTHAIPVMAVLFSAAFFLVLMQGSYGKKGRSEILKKILILFLNGFLATLIAMIWYFPMIQHLDLVSGKFLTLSIDSLKSLFLRWWPLFFASIAACMAIYRRRIDFMFLFASLSFIFLFILIASGASRFAEFGILHPYRALGMAFFIFPLILGGFTEMATQGVSSRLVKVGIFGFIVCAFTFSSFHGRVEKWEDGLNYGLPVAEGRDILRAMAEVEGNIFVEGTGNKSRLLPYLDALETQSGLSIHKHFMYSVLVESSALSVFYIPFARALSFEYVSAPLTHFQSLTKDNIERLISLGDAFGINAYVSISPKERKYLESSSQLSKQYENLEFALFTRMQKPCEVCLIRNPVAVVSRLDLTDREKDNFDFVRLQEIFMEDYRQDTALALIDSNDADIAHKLSFFKKVIVAEETKNVLTWLNTNEAKRSDVFTFEPIKEKLGENTQEYIDHIYPYTEAGAREMIRDL